MPTTAILNRPAITHCCCSTARATVLRRSCGRATYIERKTGPELLLPEIERQQELGKEVVFRADAAFAKPEIYEALEERGVKYAIRIPANDSLERDIVELLTRPVGRPSHKPVVWYKGFLYQAASGKTARRVVAKVEFHTGELFPRVGFIVTNLDTTSRAVVRFYNKRGTAEQWIKEGKQAVKMTRLSCHRFRSNQVRLALSLLAYNLGNLWRRLVAQADRELVADELAATIGEDRWAAGQACPLLLASAGGRTSEPTAVRSDARPNRAATPTDGIASWWRNRRAEPGYSGVGVRRCVAKVGHKWGRFALCWCGWQTVGSASDEKSFSRCPERSRRVYYGAVFEVKKEIPMKMLRERITRT